MHAWYSRGLRGWILILIATTSGACSRETGAPPPLDGSPDQAPPDAAPPPDLSPDQAVPDLSPGTGPPYPIILVHGFFGFDKIGPLTYFHKVQAALKGRGHDVHVASLDPFNSTKKRGAALLKQVNTILLQTGSARVNLIGHSQGGLDSRWVAAQIPNRIGAVATIGTPHLGAKIADILLGNAPGFTVELAKAFFAAVSRPFYGDVAKDADVKACLESLSTSSVTAFNASFPDQPQVTYYSIGGRSNSRLAKTECFAPMAPPFISKYDKEKDPVDALLYITCKVIGGSLLDPKPNDGLVLVERTKWGTWLGCIPADHWDQVGQLLGDSPGFGNAFDHLEFYRDLAKYLVAKGF